jgi:hypothetical protein
MTIVVYVFLSNANKSSVSVFITTMKNSVAETSTCRIRYCNEVSVFYMFMTLDVRGIKDIRLISRPIHVPSHELEDIDTSTPLLK